MTFHIHVGPNIRKSAYFDATVADGVRSFSVYNHMYIPGNFGDPDAEYDRLIHGVAMWDVAAQRQVELRGPDATALVQYLTPRNLADTKAGQGRYVPFCDHQGLLINDPVLLKFSDQRYWLSIADSDIALWASAIAYERDLNVEVFEPDVSPMAIQGPKATKVAETLFGAWVVALRHFGFRETNLQGIPLVVARSGWSKQGGFELYLKDGSCGSELWHLVRQAGQEFGIGPAAPNDIERLESGLISYGADMRRQTHPADPFEMGFGAMIDLDGHDFVGREALRRAKANGLKRRRVGFLIEGAPVAGNTAPLDVMFEGRKIGHLSEMAFSRRLGQSIGIGLVSTQVLDNQSGLSIPYEGGTRPVRLAKLPFS